MVAVSVRQVTKSFGPTHVLRGVDVHVPDGGFAVLVGPSGCGKSTLLRLIAGLEEVTAGTIHFGEREVTHLEPRERDIAMVFQSYALYPHLTVRDNLAFGLRLRKTDEAVIRQRVAEAAAMLGLEALLDRLPKALSGGQRQRVALGRAIVREPKVFLFDEPLSNLDAKLRVTTRTEIKNLHQRLGVTTVYVTHDQEEAMTLGDRIVVMSDGRIQQVDTPLHIYRKPANRFVAAFLGAPPMNFLNGTVAERNGAIYFDFADVPPLRMLERFKVELRPHQGRPLVLGFRPSAVSESATGKYAAAGATLRLHAALVEPLGEVMDVSCKTPKGQPLMVRIAARDDFPVGKEVDLHLDMDHVHVFEPGEFGRNLMASR